MGEQKNTLPTENEHISTVTPDIQHSQQKDRSQSWEEENLVEAGSVPSSFSKSFDIHSFD
jgi:hypothetical protein